MSTPDPPSSPARATPPRTPEQSELERRAVKAELAVLEARCGVRFAQNDVYLNVAGGLRVTETGADLAVAAALISSVTGRPAPQRTVFFGEVALSAELRQVAKAEARLKEAAKLGFNNAVMPCPRKSTGKIAGIAMAQTSTLGELIEIMGGIN